MNAMKLAIPLFVAALVYGPAQGWAAAILGTAETYAVLAGSTVTNTGFTILNGNLGLSPGSSVTGFPPGIVNGVQNVANAVALQAKSDLVTAYNALAGLAVNTVLTGTDLGGLTLTQGVYFFASSAQLTGQLILDGAGDPDAFWVFQIGSTLTTASNSSVVFQNEAGNNAPVYWQVGSSATLGTGTDFVGTIVALTSIGLNTDADIVCGRALARNGAVTLDDNTISIGPTTGSTTGCGSLQLNGGVVTGPGPGGGEIIPAPEPATLLLFGFGLAGLFAFRKKLVPVA